MKILTIFGSLRDHSSNTKLLQALALLAPDGVTVVSYRGLGHLPHFSPDLDLDPAPADVAGWRDQLRSADAVVISARRSMRTVSRVPARMRSIGS